MEKGSLLQVLGLPQRHCTYVPGLLAAAQGSRPYCVQAILNTHSDPAEGMALQSGAQPTRHDSAVRHGPSHGGLRVCSWAAGLLTAPAVATAPCPSLARLVGPYRPLSMRHGTNAGGLGGEEWSSPSRRGLSSAAALSAYLLLVACRLSPLFA